MSVSTRSSGFSLDDEDYVAAVSVKGGPTTPAPEGSRVMTKPRSQQRNTPLMQASVPASGCGSVRVFAADEQAVGRPPLQGESQLEQRLPPIRTTNSPAVEHRGTTMHRPS